MLCSCLQSTRQSSHRDRHAFKELLDSAKAVMLRMLYLWNYRECKCGIRLGLDWLLGTISHLESPPELFRHLWGALRGAVRGCRGSEGRSSADCYPLRLPLRLTLCVLSLQALQLSLCTR